MQDLKKVLSLDLSEKLQVFKSVITLNLFKLWKGNL